MSRMMLLSLVLAMPSIVFGQYPVFADESDQRHDVPVLPQPLGNPTWPPKPAVILSHVLVLRAAPATLRSLGLDATSVSSSETSTEDLTAKKPPHSATLPVDKSVLKNLAQDKRVWVLAGPKLMIVEPYSSLLRVLSSSKAFNPSPASRLLRGHREPVPLARAGEDRA